MCTCVRLSSGQFGSASVLSQREGVEGKNAVNESCGIGLASTSTTNRIVGGSGDGVGVYQITIDRRTVAREW